MRGYKQHLGSRSSYNYLDHPSQNGPVISMAKSELAAKVGAAIRTARKRRGLVQRNIAEDLKIDVAAVGMWEGGRNLPTTENLVKAAEILRVDPAALSRGDLVFLD